VLDPPRRHAQRVQRFGVGPVTVLDDEDGRAACANLGEERAGAPTASAASSRPKGCSKVVERRERRRHGEWLAASDVDRHVGRRGEGTYDRRLADPGLTGEEDERPAALACVRERRFERGQLGLALEERPHSVKS
jgi:hypothetical protein